MKNLLKKWLGITAIEERVQKAEGRHKKLQQQMITLLKKLHMKNLDAQLEILIADLEAEGTGRD